MQSNSSVTRTNYFRILVLASIDLLLTLPIGVVTIVLSAIQLRTQGITTFYSGWASDHTNWEPESYPYEEIVSLGASSLAPTYFVLWTSPVLALAIIALFGITAEARASYRRCACIVAERLGWKASVFVERTRTPLEKIEFGERSDPESALVDTELRCAIVTLCTERFRLTFSGQFTDSPF